MSILFAQIWLLLASVSAPPIMGAGAPDVKVVDFAGLEEYLSQYDDRTLVVNFWATWCVPCVKEMPYFEQVTENYAEEDLTVVLVSLDFTEKKVASFIEKHALKSKVILLDDPDQNAWIDKVDPRWSGAIPVTIIRKNGKQEFFEGSFHDYDDLNTFIQSFLNS